MTNNGEVHILPNAHVSILVQPIKLSLSDLDWLALGGFSSYLSPCLAHNSLLIANSMWWFTGFWRVCVGDISFPNCSLEPVLQTSWWTMWRCIFCQNCTQLFLCSLPVQFELSLKYRLRMELLWMGMYHLVSVCSLELLHDGQCEVHILPKVHTSALVQPSLQI